MKFDHVFLIGLGGTGSHLVGPLVQLLWHHPNGTGSVTLIDGDKYERKNATRQVFKEVALGANKAEASAERVVGVLGAVTTVNEYVDKEKFTRLLESRHQVRRSLMCVLGSIMKTDGRTIEMKYC